MKRRDLERHLAHHGARKVAEGGKHTKWRSADGTRATALTYSLFARADLVGEFDTREGAERALDELVAAEPSAAEEFAVFEFDESGKRVGEQVTRSAASVPSSHCVRP